jgi:hypothetical protein
VFENILDRICACWQKLGIATHTLTVIEPLCYSIAFLLLAINAGWLYFVGTGCATLLGVAVSKSKNSDAGRTLTELYCIDVFVQFSWIGIFFATTEDPWFERASFAYGAITTGLCIARLAAISAAVGVPGQAGWPKLIPFTTHLRDIQGTKKQDFIVYGVLTACMLFGIWIQSFDKPINPMIWLAPALMIIVIDALKIKSVKAVEKLSPRAKDWAIKFDGFLPEEQDLTENIIETVLKARRTVAAREAAKFNRK